VYTADAKLYKFDKAGNESAEALLKDTATKAGVAVTVEGTIDGDTIKVTKLTEKTE
jgi:endonuclease YncB( thermonuclease family)